MKALLVFELPAESNEHREAVNAPQAWGMLRELDEELRRVVKYGATLQPEGLRARILACLALVED